MAELLVHKIGRGDPTDKRDWQPFDVVVVYPDGHTWGRNQLRDNGTFLVMKFPGMPVADVEHLLEEVEGVTRRLRTIDNNSLEVKIPVDIDGRISWPGGELIGDEAQQAKFISSIVDKP